MPYSGQPPAACTARTRTHCYLLPSASYRPSLLSAEETSTQSLSQNPCLRWRTCARARAMLIKCYLEVSSLYFPHHRRGEPNIHLIHLPRNPVVLRAHWHSLILQLLVGSFENLVRKARTNVTNGLVLLHVTIVRCQ